MSKLPEAFMYAGVAVSASSLSPFALAMLALRDYYQYGSESPSAVEFYNTMFPSGEFNPFDSSIEPIDVGFYLLFVGFALGFTGMRMKDRARA